MIFCLHFSSFFPHHDVLWEQWFLAAWRMIKSPARLCRKDVGRRFRPIFTHLEFISSAVAKQVTWAVRSYHKLNKANCNASSNIIRPSHRLLKEILSYILCYFRDACVVVSLDKQRKCWCQTELKTHNVHVNVLEQWTVNLNWCPHPGDYPPVSFIGNLWFCE